MIWTYGQYEQAQRTYLPDSLLQKSYEDLARNFYQYKKNFPRAYAYAQAYLKKGIFDKDTVRQADAWYFLSLIHKPVVAEKYADSIISLTKTIEDDTYPARGFLVKGLAMYRTGKYKEALNQWVEASEYATANKNASQQLEIKYQIGALRTDLGENEEALAIFRPYLQEAAKKYENDKSNLNSYIKGLFALGDAYNRNKKYDSAALMNKKGFEVSLKNKDSISAKYFVLSMGVTEYFKGNYYAALDSIRKVEKALIMRNDASSLKICYLYAGKIYRNQGKIKEAILYFKKVDSIVEKDLDVFPDIRDAYVSLTNYYSKEKDAVNELKYTKRFLSVDSLLDTNDRYLRKEIKENIDYQQLIHQITDQKAIIVRQRKNQIIWLILLSTALISISAFTYYYYKRQRIYRARLNALLNGTETEKKQLSNESGTTAVLQDLNHIAPETLDRILKSLAVFEEEKEFLDNDISLHTMARRSETNSRYITDIIKARKGKSFRSYIRDLRIIYVVERLKTDTHFRKYTIEAIAEEAGFKTAGTFSRAFYKRTGVYPSHFIKVLRRRNM